MRRRERLSVVVSTVCSVFTSLICFQIVSDINGVAGYAPIPFSTTAAAATLFQYLAGPPALHVLHTPHLWSRPTGRNLKHRWQYLPHHLRPPSPPKRKADVKPKAPTRRKGSTKANYNSLYVLANVVSQELYCSINIATPSRATTITN